MKQSTFVINKSTYIKGFTWHLWQNDNTQLAYLKDKFLRPLIIKDPQAKKVNIIKSWWSFRLFNVRLNWAFAVLFNYRFFILWFTLSGLNNYWSLCYRLNFLMGLNYQAWTYRLFNFIFYFWRFKYILGLKYSSLMNWASLSWLGNYGSVEKLWVQYRFLKRLPVYSWLLRVDTLLNTWTSRNNFEWFEFFNNNRNIKIKAKLGQKFGKFGIFRNKFKKDRKRILKFPRWWVWNKHFFSRFNPINKGGFQKQKKINNSNSQHLSLFYSWSQSKYKRNQGKSKKGWLKFYPLTKMSQSEQRQALKETGFSPWYPVWNNKKDQGKKKKKVIWNQNKLFNWKRTYNFWQGKRSKLKKKNYKKLVLRNNNRLVHKILWDLFKLKRTPMDWAIAGEIFNIGVYNWVMESRQSVLLQLLINSNNSIFNWNLWPNSTNFKSFIGWLNFLSTYYKSWLIYPKLFNNFSNPISLYKSNNELLKFKSYLFTKIWKVKYYQAWLTYSLANHKWNLKVTKSRWVRWKLKKQINKESFLLKASKKNPWLFATQMLINNFKNLNYKGLGSNYNRLLISKSLIKLLRWKYKWVHFLPQPRKKERWTKKKRKHMSGKHRLVVLNKHPIWHNKVFFSKLYKRIPVSLKQKIWHNVKYYNKFCWDRYNNLYGTLMSKELLVDWLSSNFYFNLKWGNYMNKDKLAWWDYLTWSIMFVHFNKFWRYKDLWHIKRNTTRHIQFEARKRCKSWIKMQHKFNKNYYREIGRLMPPLLYCRKKYARFQTRPYKYSYRFAYMWHIWTDANRIIRVKNFNLGAYVFNQITKWSKKYYFNWNFPFYGVSLRHWASWMFWRRVVFKIFSWNWSFYNPIDTFLHPVHRGQRSPHKWFFWKFRRPWVQGVIKQLNEHDLSIKKDKHNRDKKLPPFNLFDQMFDASKMISIRYPEMALFLKKYKKFWWFNLKWYRYKPPKSNNSKKQKALKQKALKQKTLKQRAIEKLVKEQETGRWTPWAEDSISKYAIPRTYNLLWEGFKQNKLNQRQLLLLKKLHKTFTSQRWLPHKLPTEYLALAYDYRRFRLSPKEKKWYWIFRTQYKWDPYQYRWKKRVRLNLNSPLLPYGRDLVRQDTRQKFIKQRSKDLISFWWLWNGHKNNRYLQSWGLVKDDKILTPWVINIYIAKMNELRKKRKKKEKSLKKFLENKSSKNKK